MTHHSNNGGVNFAPPDKSEALADDSCDVSQKSLAKSHNAEVNPILVHNQLKSIDNIPQVTVKPPNPNKGKTIVDLHGKKYMFAKKRIDEEIKNVKEIRKIKLYMTSSKIECLKHNSSLDEECQNFGSFKAII